MIDASLCRFARRLRAGPSTEALQEQVAACKFAASLHTGRARSEYHLVIGIQDKLRLVF